MNTVEPIRDLDVVMDIAEYLKGKSDRDYMMFMFGIYTGLRISDILKFRVRDVKGKDAVYIREKKTGKEKRFPINAELKPVIKDYIYGKDDYEYLFKSPRGNRPITRQQAYNILSEAGRQFDIDKIGTHTLRKTFGYHTGLGFAQGLQRETQGLADIITGNLPTTVQDVSSGASGLQKSNQQLNLTIQMDGNVVGKAALNTVDMLQGAKVNLTRRGIANA